MEEERNAKNDTSMMARLSAKIINNLQVRVNHIHIRFEDHSSCPGHPFAAGVILEELRLYSPSEGDTPLIPRRDAQEGAHHAIRCVLGL